MLGILGNMGYNFNAGLLRGIGNSSSRCCCCLSAAPPTSYWILCLPALGLGIGGRGGSHGDCTVFIVDMQHFYIRRHCTELALPVLPCGFDAALRQIVRIGLPLGLNSALYPSVTSFLQVLYNLQGSVFVAAAR